MVSLGVTVLGEFAQEIAVLATSLVRPRIVEDFTDDKGLKLWVVSEQIGLVLEHVVGKLRRAFTATTKAVREALRPRPRPSSIIGGLAADLLRSHVELVAENVLLRTAAYRYSKEGEETSFPAT